MSFVQHLTMQLVAVEELKRAGSHWSNDLRVGIVGAVEGCVVVPFDE